MTDLPKDLSPDGLDFETAVHKTEEELRRYLRQAPPVIRRLTTHLAKSTGKMIRARALLICAIQSNDFIDPDAVKAAAAAELLHLATLIHDDIIDDAAKRRGIEALHRRFGEKMAVLCGDYLLCMALELATAIRTLQDREDTVGRSFPSYITDVCLGEMRQNQNNYNYRLSEREYFKIIGGKTAALFEACFYIGYLFSDEHEGFKDTYKEIGNTTGIIFQLSDDCADYEATQKQAKKPVLSDYSRGVITLPLIFSLKTDPTLTGRIKDGLSPAALKKAVHASGGLDYTHAKIDTLYKKAKNLIDSLDIRAGKREMLARVLEKAAAASG